MRTAFSPCIRLGGMSCHTCFAPIQEPSSHTRRVARASSFLARQSGNLQSKTEKCEVSSLHLTHRPDNGWSSFIGRRNARHSRCHADSATTQSELVIG